MKQSSTLLRLTFPCVRLSNKTYFDFSSQQHFALLSLFPEMNKLRKSSIMVYTCGMEVLFSTQGVIASRNNFVFVSSNVEV